MLRELSHEDTHPLACPPVWQAGSEQTRSARHTDPPYLQSVSEVVLLEASTADGAFSELRQALGLKALNSPLT